MRSRGSRLRRSSFLAGVALAAVAGAEPVLVERILAVVDGRPVLLSEVRVVEQLTGQERGSALEALIDERLMFREASRLPQAALSPDEETRALESLRARGGAALAGLPEPDLRQIARRQATILKYVEFRFRPQVRVEEQLAEEDLRQRIEAWVKELRRGADVRYNAAPSSATARPAS